jgi:primosomal protein N'
LETYYRAKQGLIKHLRLTERPGGSILPEVAIVDMRAELAQKNFHVLSGKLRRGIDCHRPGGTPGYRAY